MAAASAGNASAGGQLENVKVAVRLRPFTERERQRNSKRIVDIEQNTVVLYNPKLNGDHKKFTFDYSYWSHDGFKRNADGVNVPDESHPNATKYVGQERVFEDLGAFLLNNALEGYNSALLAYGQTGSGKSYTVSGYGQNEGILPRFARALFAELDKRTGLDGAAGESGGGSGGGDGDGDGPAEARPAAEAGPKPSSKNRYEVYFSMIEIYNEVVRDLLAQGHGYPAPGQPGAGQLARRGLKVREHPKRGFFVEGLVSYPCASKEQIEQRIEQGQLNKSIAATSMNETSSRGHTIYEFRIKQFRGPQDTPRARPAEAGAPGAAAETLTTSVVQLVDLAGSERLAVHVTGQLGGDSFIGSRSGSPFARLDGDQQQQQQHQQPAAGARRRNASSVRLPPNSASSTGSSSTAAPAGQLQTSGSRAAHHRGAAHSNSLYGSHQQRFKESVSINQSLSALGNCIQVMSQYSQQADARQSAPKIPYRDSVLTKLMNRCCLSGNSKVVIIATLSPADANHEDTLSTLRFADRAKQIKTHAKINRMSRGEIVDVLQKENERLKQMIDGRVTRSDDSSQTSNFDDTENLADNFKGPRGLPGQAEARAGPNRAASSSRPPARGAGQTESRSVNARGPSRRLAGSNPALNEQMKGLVSPAAKKLASREAAQAARLADELAAGSLSGMRKSKSMATGLAAADRVPRQASTAGDNGDDDLDADVGREKLGRGESFLVGELAGGRDDGAGRQRPSPAQLNELVASDMLDELDLSELADIEAGDEGLLSPVDSDDSFAALADEGLTNEQKIGLLNRLLSNSGVADRLRKQHELRALLSKAGPARPSRRANQRPLDGLQRVTALSSSLKKSNPYLSNLNPDEQLTGVITYLIKLGETVVGKSGDCDIQLYGPELRGRHARITRLEPHEPGAAGRVFIEPIVEPNRASSGPVRPAPNVALLVNGTPLEAKTQLHHCDRLLFGSNAYFVFVDRGEQAAASQPGGGAPSLADQDLVTYDMAHAEVLRKVMSDAKNEAVLQEIKGYTHRPATGKHRDQRPGRAAGEPAAKAPDGAPMAQVKSSRLARSMTIHGDQDQEAAPAASPAGRPDSSQAPAAPSARDIGGQQDGPSFVASEQLEANYREKLLEDTYEYAMPVAEVNTIAKEMRIKVSYGLKILTGEEQMPDGCAFNLDSSNSDSLSSMSGSLAGSGADQQQPQAQQAPAQTRPQSEGNSTLPAINYEESTREAPVVSRSIKPDSLDVAPALFVHVHLDELDMDFYWSKEKFQARRFRILELYGAWDVGGKSGLVEHLIEQSRSQADFVLDPFVDEPLATPVLIGHAQVALKPLSHRSDLDEQYDVLDLNDEIVASLRVQATPCRHSGGARFEPFSERELAECLLAKPGELLGKPFSFLIRIASCAGLARRYSRVHCQYSLDRHRSVVRTSQVAREQSVSGAARGEAEIETETETETEAGAEPSPAAPRDEPLEFNHLHYVHIERVDRDILDFLEHGFLAIQLVGCYRLDLDRAADEQGRQQLLQQAANPTIITTIINSIQKFRFKIEQQGELAFGGGGGCGANYSAGSLYTNSLTDSAKSERHRHASSAGLLNSGASSVASTSATVNLFDQQNDDDADAANSMNGLSQENIIDMILTKRKLDRAENQLHYLKRTINIAEHYNKKHIPVKTVKKLLNSYGHEIESGSLEEMVADVNVKGKSASSKNSACVVQ